MTTPRSDASERLVEVLSRAQAVGFLGAAPVRDHLAHSEAFVDAVGAASRDRVADLGSGAGLPGLVIAVFCPEVTVVLVEASQRRADHLRRAVRQLGLRDRVAVDERPAEQVGREVSGRGSFDTVVARGFGPPPVVAECAAPLLRPGGSLLVSEPPDSDGRRWDPLTSVPLGLGPAEMHPGPAGAIARLRLEGTCDPRYPRSVGVPARRPLF